MAFNLPVLVDLEKYSGNCVNCTILIQNYTPSTCTHSIDYWETFLSMIEHFKDCISRKDITIQNVMAKCDFNMCFMLAWAKCEGVAHDAYVFLEALRRLELSFLHPPKGLQMKISKLLLWLNLCNFFFIGKYYLVVIGHPQMSGYLGPYKVSVTIF